MNQKVPDFTLRMVRGGDASVPCSVFKLLPLPVPAVLEWAAQTMCTLIKSSVGAKEREPGESPDCFNPFWRI